ncbi:MAG: cupin domain-containing protein [Pleurocapsa sp. MO_192.B19]|nr:cupin domain-containing protein [Pleurocapsa sp. MO_192.B19]
MTNANHNDQPKGSTPNPTPPRFSYWHVWTDDDGVSHQTQCELTNFKQESMSGNAAPQWNNRLMNAESKIVFAELPVGWVGLGVGEVSFGGDQNTQPNADGLQGHLSGTVGEEPAKLMIVQLEGAKWIGIYPGEFS